MKNIKKENRERASSNSYASTDNLPTANEPSIQYQSYASKENEFKIFNSFAEAEDDNNKWLASLTPEQHLQNAVQLIKRLYTDALKSNPEIDTNFKID